MQKVIDQPAKSDLKVPSIGVLSPFRKQADHLAEAILKQFSQEILEKHRILVGTPYTFQGAERDLMFISWALCGNSHPTAFHYLERGGVFNVAITRARTKQFVVTSLKASDVPREHLLGSYLGILEQRSIKETESQKSPCDTFAKEVTAELVKHEIEVKSAYPMAGMMIDMVLIKEGRYIGVDLIGYPGAFTDYFAVERYFILARAGLKLLPLAFIDWCLRPRVCIEMLIRELRQAQDG